MKIKLSSYPWGLCISCVLLALFFLFMIITRAQNNDISKDGEFKRLLVEPLIDLVLLAVLLLWTFTWSRVEFDQENLYIRRFRKKRETIPFKHIVYLGDLMPYSLSPKFISFYTLGYKNENGELKKVRWHRQTLNFNYTNIIEQFIALIRMKNPSFIREV